MPRDGIASMTDLRSLLESQRYRCALTGRELTPETTTLDHKVPVALGGLSTVDNLWFVHFQANSAKGSLTTDEFVKLCRDVVSYCDSLPVVQQEMAERLRPSLPTNGLFDT
jgi:5-methylcytosine-specific restriction endonuclease McrA